MACDVIAARYVLCLLLFLGFMVTFLLRANLNIAIVAMVKARPESSNLTALSSQSQCGTGTVMPLKNDTALLPKNETLQSEVLFEWNEFQQGVILASFFWGYVVFQVPGGRIAELHGTKRVYGSALLINGLLCFVLPLAAKMHWTLLLLIRALQGLAQGVVFPAMSAIVVRWVPLAERARFVSFAFQGASLGTVVALPLCGWVLSSTNWETVFYVSGGLTLLWTAAWWLLVFDSPDQHPRISDSERRYLAENLDPVQSKAPAVPWKEAMSSKQFWVGSWAGIGNDWGFHTFFTLGPKYMKSALGFDLEQSSWLSSLPFLSQYVFAMLYGSLADHLIKRGVSLVFVRKISVVVSHLLPVVGLVILVILSATGCNVVLSVVVLTLCVTMIGAVTSGFFQMPMDIAPNFAGVLTGVMNGLGSTTPVVSMALAGGLLETYKQLGWRYIFLIAAAMYVIGALPYLLFYRARIEPWNSPKDENEHGEDIDLEPETKIADG